MNDTFSNTPSHLNGMLWCAGEVVSMSRVLYMCTFSATNLAKTVAIIRRYPSRHADSTMEDDNIQYIEW